MPAKQGQRMFISLFEVQKAIMVIQYPDNTVLAHNYRFVQAKLFLDDQKVVSSMGNKYCLFCERGATP
jgi:hypothetical protein